MTQIESCRESRPARTLSSIPTFGTANMSGGTLKLISPALLGVGMLRIALLFSFLRALMKFENASFFGL